MHSPDGSILLRWLFYWVLWYACSRAFLLWYIIRSERESGRKIEERELMVTCGVLPLVGELTLFFVCLSISVGAILRFVDRCTKRS